MRWKMKFRHRAVIISSLVALVFITLVMLYNGYVTRIFGSHQEFTSDEFIRKNPLKFNLVSGKHNTGQCRSIFEQPKHVISTLDIAERTNYTTLGGDYPLPHQSLDEAAYKPDIKPLTVIILPHSHVDPGWVETLDHYYVNKVKSILDGMVRKLHEYPDMTFVWAEIVFFSRWWTGLSDLVRLQVRELIEQGRFEIALGGWVMPDEASTHYISLIDQLIVGHQWLIENLGIKPNISWSIDPFGHSGTLPYLWKLAGMSDMVIQRIHQATKGQMIKEKSLEFYWRQQWSESAEADIFCHVMPYMLYSLHHTCGPNKYQCAIYDFRQIKGEMGAHFAQSITDDNIVNRAKTLYEQYRLKSSVYQHNTILVPLGDDFRYNHLEEWDQQYENYKKLMNHMNSQQDWKITVKFGTLSDYFNLVGHDQKSSDIDYPFVSGDFFPYSDHDNAYWTGYYTTRPFDKRFAREVETRLRAAEILHSIAISYSVFWKSKYIGLDSMPRLLREARENVGLFLHHDAITGTGRSYVVEDYEEKLFKAYDDAITILGCAAQFLLTKGKLDSQPSIFLPEMNRKDPKTSSMHNKLFPTKEGTRVVLYNPTGHMRTEFVEIIVDSFDLEITDSKRNVMPFQINPVYTSPTEVDRSAFEVVFLSEVPAFGLETYTLWKINRTPKSFWSKITVYNSEEFIVAPELLFDQVKPRRRGNLYESIMIENKHMAAEFKSVNGLLTKVIDKTDNSSKPLGVNLDFKQYTSRGSGAYIFFPMGPAKDMLPGLPVIRVVEGPLCSEVQVVFKNIYHKVRLYNHPGLQGTSLLIQNAVDMFFLNMRDREPIMRISTDIENKPGRFFVDENGFQFIGRKRHPSDPELARIERNYYPMTTMAFIQDRNRRVSLHSGQPLGVASLDAGQLEVMLDRQLLYDDERGLGEGISDNKLTMTKFILQIECADVKLTEEKFSYPSIQSLVTNEFLNQPIQKIFTPINSDILSLSFSPLLHPLPCDVFLVSMKSLLTSNLRYNGTSVIVHRRGSRCGFSDDGLQCTESDINVDGFFPWTGVTSKETTLTHTTVKTDYVELDRLTVPVMEIKAYLFDVKPYKDEL